MNVYTNALCELSGYDFDSYKEMYEMSTKSILDNVKEIDKHICITGKFNNAFDMFMHIFLETSRIAQDGNNVLFVDIDMLCMKPVSIFGKHSTFCMFGGWDNSNGRAAPFTNYQKYLCASPRYIPSERADWFRSRGLDLWINATMPALWDFEQLLYNKIIREQEDFDLDKYFGMREYNYIVDPRAITQCKLEDAIFMHFSGSLDPKGVVKKMKDCLEVKNGR